LSDQPLRGWHTFGHPGALRLLGGAISLGRVSHAYLITGSAQVGKRTLALDIARAVNCTPSPDMFGETPQPPCGRCAPCDRITRGLHADVRVIDVNTELPSADGRSESGQGSNPRSRKNIRIEHIAELQREASLKPFEGRRRVFIVDEAEAMSAEAANRLLKTLEEPAEEVMIVLVSASPDSLPPTVVSRCQRIELRLVPREEIERALVDRFGAEPEDAAVLSRIARGCPGWAIDALNDPTAMDKRTQSAQRILSVLTGDIEERFRYAREASTTFTRDRAAGTAEIETWLDWWRDVAFAANGLEKHVVNADWLPSLSAVGSALKSGELSAAVDAVERTLDALRANAMPRLALEVMMLDLPGVDGSAVPQPGAPVAGEGVPSLL
jgi:DNA polymerase-3 subunit delta'